MSAGSSAMTGKLSLATVNGFSETDFSTRFGGMFEHAPWVAGQVVGLRPFGSVTEMHRAMVGAIRGADRGVQLALINGHPDLAGRAALAGDMTAHSVDEQASAGLSALTPEEMADFNRLNGAYRGKFGFTFIMAVRNAGKRRILDAFARRIEHAPDKEFDLALSEVSRIGWMRLLEMVEPAPTGRLTTHVLDTANGRPADGLSLTLWRIDGSGRRQIGAFRTNSDGRLDRPALEGSALLTGSYEFVFEAGAYFAPLGRPTGPDFLDEIPLRFAIDNPEQHWHVPLLVSPFAYSTYRGS
jgi:2-oxo-4-hydroxy-4-carboxy-5-ureidoimidazoline decarboxylase